jgi:hypothetical protein
MVMRKIATDERDGALAANSSGDFCGCIKLQK